MARTFPALIVSAVLVATLPVEEARAGGCCEFPNRGGGAIGCARAVLQAEIRQCRALGGVLVANMNCNVAVTNDCDLVQFASRSCDGKLTPADPKAFGEFLAALPHLRQSTTLDFHVEARCEVIPPSQVGELFFQALPSYTTMSGDAALAFVPQSRRSTPLMQVVVAHQDLEVEPLKIVQLAGFTFELRIEGMELMEQAVWFDPRDYSLFGDLAFLTRSNIGAFEERGGFTSRYDTDGYFRLDFAVLEMTPLLSYGKGAERRPGYR